MSHHYTHDHERQAQIQPSNIYMSSKGNNSPPPYHEATYQASQPAAPTPTLQAEDLNELSAALAWIRLSPSPPQPYPRRLPQPIAIPQIAPRTLLSGPQPFTRAYAPLLAHYSISLETFVAFIDGLTLAQAPAPPLQAVQVVGMGLGVVPHHWAQLASAGVGLAAGVGTAAVSAARTKRYLAEANARFFQGRGLKVRIVGDEELWSQVLGMRGYEAAKGLAEVDMGRSVLTVTERRLEMLRGYVAQLTFDVPPPTQAEGMLDRISAKQVASKEKRGREKAEKAAYKDADRKADGKRPRKKERERTEKELKSVHKLKWIVVEDLNNSGMANDGSERLRG